MSYSWCIVEDSGQTYLNGHHDQGGGLIQGGRFSYLSFLRKLKQRFTV